MKIYISGPMTGIKDNNRIEFCRAEALLKGKGHTVINPIGIVPLRTIKLTDSSSITQKIETPVYTDYLRSDLKSLLDCDAIYLLEGWKESKGACVEVTVAVALRLIILSPHTEAPDA